MSLKLVYEGKSKRVYEKSDEELIMEFKDEVTALDGAVRSVIEGKGVLTARMSAFFFRVLEDNGVQTHFIDYDSYRRMTVRKLAMMPLEVIVRNYAYGSLMKRMPLFKVLQRLDPPIVEFHYKDDSLHDPLVLTEDILRVGLLSRDELERVVDVTLKVNDVLSKLFEPRGLKLVDLKLEFGRDKNGRIIVADEISGDTFRVLDERGEHLDKEVFRKTRDARLMLDAYARLCKVLGLKTDDVVQS